MAAVLKTLANYHSWVKLTTAEKAGDFELKTAI